MALVLIYNAIQHFYIANLGVYGNFDCKHFVVESKQTAISNVDRLMEEAKELVSQFCFRLLYIVH